MHLITHNATVVCAHELGKVSLNHTQQFVRILGQAVLVENDPEGCSISGCPNTAPAIKPCLTTLRVKEGYSALLRIGGRRVCLSSLSGFTDGTPPGVVKYKVREPGQQLVTSGA